MEKGNQPAGGEGVTQATAGGAAATATPADNGTSSTDPRFTNPDGSPMTPDQLREAALDAETWADGMQNNLERAIANGELDTELISDQQRRIDQYRAQAQEARDLADALEQAQQPTPPPAAPQAGPSGEVINEDGTRRGVDESGRPYQTDASGDQSDRERFDRFGPPGASTK